ncbi:MAG TPA: endolytic transglycosylase MltG [Lutibacter sp.]|nr:endolytic transglycosylase MltG [Lutibacter sp.]
MITKKHLIYAAFLVLIGFGAIFGNLYYGKIYKTNVLKTGTIYIPTNASFDEVESIVRPFLRRVTGFRWVAKKKKYTQRIKSGKYEIKKGMNNNELVNLLRSGNQTTVKVRFNNQDSLEKLAGRIAQQIEPDSLALLQVMKDEAFWSDNGFSKANALSMYIPNSYEFYWNTSAASFQHKMLKEYKKFWNESRNKKAKKIGLSPAQVITLASIVQKETANIPERKTVAGLYLNRYKNKWPLQADPTVIYALKLKNGMDKEYKQVLYKHLEIDSPYNTYKHNDLPPGPIGMPDISAIDAVLTPSNHDYYFMCASVSDFGKHVFAKTLAQHNVNARKYQRWLAKQGY